MATPGIIKRRARKSYTPVKMGVPAESVDNEIEYSAPSSPESCCHFDAGELLNLTALGHDDIILKLVAAGPTGVAAAAALMTSRKRMRCFDFEPDPCARKRQCSKLLRRMSDLVDELCDLGSERGLQAAVATFVPASGNRSRKFKMFGSAPLTAALRKRGVDIAADMGEALDTAARATSARSRSREPPDKVGEESLHELPPLLFDGIPTTFSKMTQAQLRTFIPNMLKYSTGRSKPGWGDDRMKPPWWPEEVVWANVRSDTRTEEQRRALSWTEALRKIVLSCYQYHGRMDLLHLDDHSEVQQVYEPRQDAMGVATGGGGVDQETFGSEMPMGTGDDPSEVPTFTGDPSEVPTYTYDTCTLAEAAARLQKVSK